MNSKFDKAMEIMAVVLNIGLILAGVWWLWVATNWFFAACTFFLTIFSSFHSVQFEIADQQEDGDL